MAIKGFIQGVIGMAYPAIEPYADEEIKEAFRDGADFVADRVEDTETKWDNEGAEKLEYGFRAAADRLKERREAFAAKQAGAGEQPSE